MDPERAVLRPIGVIHSQWGTRDEVPLGGAPAMLEVFPEFEAAMDGVERSSHLVVLAWLHQADRSVLMARSRRIDPEVPERGVFGTRSPDRPNPVSVSVVPLLRREGLRVHVDHLDLLDGTPLVDLKPYDPGWDGVFGARHPKRVRQSRIPDGTLLVFLRRDLQNYLGPLAETPEARVGLAAVFHAIRAFDLPPREEALSVRTGRCDAALDALVGLMGGHFASGRVGIDPGIGKARFRFQAGDRTLTVIIREDRQEVFAREDPLRWVSEGLYEEDS